MERAMHAGDVPATTAAAAAQPAADDRLHAQFAAFTAFTMTVIAIAASVAVLA